MKIADTLSPVNINPGKLQTSGAHFRTLKLIKYHTYKNFAIFFFLHRSKNIINRKDKLQESQTLKGIYFL